MEIQGTAAERWFGKANSHSFYSSPAKMKLHEAKMATNQTGLLLPEAPVPSHFSQPHQPALMTSSYCVCADWDH